MSAGNPVPISQLPAATLPLADTDLVPITQSGATKKAPLSAFKTAAAGTALSIFGMLVPNGTGDDTAALNAAILTGKAYVTERLQISGTVNVKGFSSADLTEQNLLVFGPRTVPELSGAGKFKMDGYAIGFAASKANLGGLLPVLDPRFSEVYGAAISGHAGGDGNGMLASAHQNGSSGLGQPCAAIAYGLMTDPGNIVFGHFGRVDLFAAGVATHEWNSFNFFGDSPDFLSGFPARGYAQTKAVGIAMTVAVGGTYRSTCGIQITREGSPTNTAQSNFRCGIYIDGMYTTDFGIVINGDGGLQQNDGHGSPKTGMLMYTCPNSDNGIVIQAAGKVSAYGSANPYLLAISSNRNTDAGVADPNNTYVCLAVAVSGTVIGRAWSIDGSTGNAYFGGSLNACNAIAGKAIGFTAGGMLFATVVSNSAGAASGNYLPVIAGGGNFKVALLNN